MSFASQIQLLNLFGPSSPISSAAAASTVPATTETNASGGSTPYESLHQLVHWGVGPWFEAFVSSRSGGQDGNARDGKGGKQEDGKMGQSQIQLLFGDPEVSILMISCLSYLETIQVFQ